MVSYHWFRLRRGAVRTIRSLCGAPFQLLSCVCIIFAVPPFSVKLPTTIPQFEIP